MKAWKLHTLVIVASVLAISAAHAETAERCAVMSQTATGAIETVFVPEFVVTGSAPFRLPPGFDEARAIMCERAAFAVGPDDYRVPVEGGLPMYIASASVTVVLEISGGQFRARVIRGELTAGERDSLLEALDRAQDMVRPSE